MSAKDATQPGIYKENQLNITDFTMRCGNGPHCRHPICVDCGKPLRANSSVANHPGTKHQYVAGNCKKCFAMHTRLTPADLEDQRHILLSDAEMAHIYEVDSFMYDWHLRRRYKLKIGEAAA